MKRLIAGLLFLAVALGAAQTAPEQDWIKYSDETGRFSVMYPGNPVHSSDTRNGVVIHYFRLAQEPRRYQVLYGDYPESVLKYDIETRLNAERDGFIASLGPNKLLDQKRFEITRGKDRLPALVFTLETEHMTHKALLVLDGVRQYLVSAREMKGSDKNITRFVDSFHLD